MKINTDVSEQYIFSQLMATADEINDKDSYLRKVIIPGNYTVLTSKVMEDVIAENELNSIKYRLIHFCYRYKETIRKIPVLGKVALNYKNKKYREAVTLPIIDVGEIVHKPFFQAIYELYEVLLEREVDINGLSTFSRLAKEGASNGAIVYIIALSREFGKRARIVNIHEYKQQYKEFRKKRRLMAIPFWGAYYQRRTSSDFLLIQAAQTIFQLEKDKNNVLSELSFIQQSLKDKEKTQEKSYDELLQRDDALLAILTSLSQKIDELPSFISMNARTNRTSVISVKSGVIGVNIGDFYLGVPEREWGLALYLANNGSMEKGSESVFKANLCEGMIVVDVGANLGLYTLHALRAGCTVYSFEASTDTFKILKQNVKVNGYAESGRINLFNKAVSDKTGKVEFYINTEMCGHSNMYETETESDIKTEVEVVSLDEELALLEKIDFIKMDIEGAEYSAFKGMEKIIKHNPNLKVLLEFAPCNIKRAGVNPRDFIRLINDYGFCYYLINDDTGEISEVTEEELLKSFSVNLLLVRNKLR